MIEINYTPMKKNFLLIEHGGKNKSFTLKAILDKGLNLYVASTTSPDWLLNFIPQENILITDTYNNTKLLVDVVSFFEYRGISVDAIGTFYEHNVAQTADVAAALNLIGIDSGAARKSSTNKLLMRKFCQRAGIPMPRYTISNINNKEHLKSSIGDIGFPSVIKPIFGSDSFGTIKIEKGYDIDKIIDEIRLNTVKEKDEIFKLYTGNVLVEEYLPGSVVSVDGVVQNRLPIFAGMVEFIMGPEPRFTQEGSYIPTRLDAKTIDDCKSMATSILIALKFNNCGFHCELRITPNGPRLLEIAARLPGGPIQLGYKQAYGIDLTSTIIDIWLGKKVQIIEKKHSYVMHKDILPKHNGVIRKIEGLDKVRAIPEIWDFLKFVRAGDKSITYPNKPVPYFYYAIESGDIETLQKISAQIEALIKVEVS